MCTAVRQESLCIILFPPDIYVETDIFKPMSNIILKFPKRKLHNKFKSKKLFLQNILDQYVQTK